MSLPAKVTFTNVNTWSGKLALELECQKHAERAVAAVLQVMDDPAVRPQHRLAAAFGILDRAYGKPMERSIALTIGDNPDTSNYQAMSTRQLLALASERLQPASKSLLDQTVISERVEGTPGIDFEKGA